MECVHNNARGRHAFDSEMAQGVVYFWLPSAPAVGSSGIGNISGPLVVHNCTCPFGFVHEPRLPVSTARIARRAALLTALLMLAGCLPRSCQRELPTALFPSDSLSRQVAAQTPMDTLQRVHRSIGPEAQTLEFPRTVRFGSGDSIYVSDAERNSLFVFDPEGTFAREIAAPAFSVPYLAGVRGDTLVVFNAGADRVDFVVGSRVVDQTDLSAARPEAETLVYAVASETALYAKAIGENTDGFIARLRRDGAIAAQVPLSGPDWRRAGLLRVWGDSLLSLSGFRPVVDVLPLDFTPSTRLDTMALVGFDSPMLERSHSFVTGQVTQAPLLSAAADASGDRLFVLNMRPGWLRIDAFDHDGRIQQRLTQPNPGPGKSFYPRDLAVRARSDGGYDLAVIFTEPTPRLDLYRWFPADTSAAPTAP